MREKFTIRIGRPLGCALILSMTGVLPGCSFLFTTAPKAPESPTAFATNKCTTSKAAPIVDTIIAGLEGVRTGLALAADESAYDKAPISRGADVALGLGFLALFGASAIYGYHVTGQCSARHDRAVIAPRPEAPEARETGVPDARTPAAPPPDDGS